MVAWRHGISLHVFNSISHSFAAVSLEMLSSTHSLSPHAHALFCMYSKVLDITLMPILLLPIVYLVSHTRTLVRKMKGLT